MIVVLAASAPQWQSILTQNTNATASSGSLPAGCTSVMRPVCKDLAGYRGGPWAWPDTLPVLGGSGLGEGNTPTVLVEERAGRRLWIKDERANPTGSHKERAMTVGVAAARQHRVSTVVAASTGNAGAAGAQTDPDVPHMYHCHRLRHEDLGMMGQSVVVDRGETAGTPAGHDRDTAFPGHAAHGLRSVWPLASLALRSLASVQGAQ